MFKTVSMQTQGPKSERGALQELKELGKQYVQDMRAKVPPSRSNATHVVDKMLRNSWNVGYISMMLPQACIIQVFTSDAGGASHHD